MLVDNPELLRTWLTDNLRPLCDADPAALSKYVLALIKKVSFFYVLSSIFHSCFRLGS